MKTVWKYALEVADEQVIEMPANAHILTVQTQQGTPCIWALVDPTRPYEPRKLLIAGTGHERKDLDDVGVSYIGTFQVMGGGLIFHVFESVIYGAVAQMEAQVALAETR